MWRIGSIVAFLVAASFSGVGAEQVRTAKPQSASQQTSPYMRVFGTALPPFGFVQFCERMASDCQPGALAEARLPATPARLSELDEVNRRVNKQIIPTTDLELYGVNEYWTIPTTHGDCEDYVLLKRRLLLERGWPASALLITVVRDEQGEGHAVLTVRTAQGDYILDNKTSDMKLWYQTGYRYVMRQSFIDPRMWMSLDHGDQGSAPLTGNRR